MQEAILSDGLLTAAFCRISTWKTPNRLIPAQTWRTAWKVLFSIYHKSNIAARAYFFRPNNIPRPALFRPCKRPPDQYKRPSENQVPAKWTQAFRRPFYRM